MRPLPSKDPARRSTRQQIEALAREREGKILTLRKQGETLDQIAEKLGMTWSGVGRAYQRALRALVPRPLIEDERRLMMARLDSLRAAANKKLSELLDLPTTPEVGIAVQKLVDALTRVEARQASLLGLDMPRAVKIDLQARFGPADLNSARTVLLDALAQDRQRGSEQGENDAGKADSRPTAPNITLRADIYYQFLSVALRSRDDRRLFRVRGRMACG
jgi:hypothetical protein